MVNSKGNAKRDHLLGTINKYKIWWLLTSSLQKKGFEKGLTLTEILREIKVRSVQEDLVSQLSYRH